MYQEGTSSEIVNAYFRYLGELVGADTFAEGNYWNLLRQLNSIEFYWTVSLDENRAADGESLRTKFFYEHNSINVDYEPFIYTPCSVLEMLIALALRMEKEYLMDWRAGSPDNTPVYFWEMISNLGLDDCTDDNWSSKTAEKIRYYVGEFLDRNYDFHGNGGIFPVSKNTRDQRKIEIWSQMHAYIMENYWQNL